MVVVERRAAAVVLTAMTYNDATQNVGQASTPRRQTLQSLTKEELVSGGCLHRG